MNKNRIPPITPILMEIDNELTKLITKAKNNGITLIACISIPDPDNIGYQFNNAKFTGETEAVLNALQHLILQISIDIEKSVNNYSKN